MKEKLVNTDWEFQIDMNDGSSSCLIIENPFVLRNTIMGLLKQSKGENGDFVLSNEKKQLDIQEQLVVITDPLNVDPSSKRISNAITQQIKDIIVSPDFYKDANDLVSHMERFADNIEDTYRLNVSHQDYEISNLYKVLNIQLQVEYEDELERIMEFMNVHHDVCGIDCFVFVSLFSYFSEEELNTLVREATSNKHNILFLEGHEPDFIPDQTRKIIIDKEACQLF